MHRWIDPKNKKCKAQELDKALAGQQQDIEKATQEPIEKAQRIAIASEDGSDYAMESVKHDETTSANQVPDDLPPPIVVEHETKEKGPDTLGASSSDDTGKGSKPYYNY